MSHTSAYKSLCWNATVLFRRIPLLVSNTGPTASSMLRNQKLAWHMPPLYINIPTPSSQLKLIGKMENVQKCAARFVCGLPGIQMGMDGLVLTPTCVVSFIGGHLNREDDFSSIARCTRSYIVWSALMLLIAGMFYHPILCAIIIP